MKTKYFILTAIAAVGLASCADDVFVGDNSPTVVEETNNDGAIKFGFDLSKVTRGDIYGPAAAELLGSNFYVTGTKGTEAATYPTDNLVFDSYLVHYEANSAGTQEDNTANWEYVGVTPGTAPYADHAKLGTYSDQTIKYWDYSTAQYDFLAFSTGTFDAVSGNSTAAGNIGVTRMAYGASLASSGTAYTFDLPSVDALKNAYISDITEVVKENYGKDVTLRFKNLGSKVRIALYETVPGYAVKDVVFYTVDGEDDFTDTNKSTTATLISADDDGLPIKGTIEVYFPHVGNTNAAAYPQDYNKAAAKVTAGESGVAANFTKYQEFGTLHNFADPEDQEPADNGLTDDDKVNYYYIGRSIPTATYAGDVNKDYYQTVFPVSKTTANAPLTLRVDYTLVSTDGTKETINVYGAKAVVPATYTVWQPNYAYTYIFKISDNTNGWTTSTDASDDNKGLYPITFDAVVAEATDATGKQTTVTTVATPTITTYQQNHKESTTTKRPDEYSIAVDKDIYVQVMDNSAVPATLVGTLSNTNSLLYDVSDLDATEAKVMDALQKRTTDIGVADIKGRNGITLTKDGNITVTGVTSIINGADNNPISISQGQASKITISGLTAGHTYAYVYDYTSGDKTTVKEYQPINVATNSAIGVSGEKHYASITTDVLKGITTFTAYDDVNNKDEDVNDAYIYFSKTTTDGGLTYTYSYVSVAGKETLPAGLLKVEKASLTKNVDGGTEAVAGTFYFDVYTTNDGKYAVKVIKIVA